MNEYYFETLKKSLEDPALTREGFNELMEKTEFFFQVLRVKLELNDPEMRAEAAKELAELKALLEKRVVAS